jgi:flagellar biosynthesis GTPase FlhF
MIAELPNFTKRLEELDSMQDHWMYLMKHLSECKEVPPQYTDPIFREAFEVARVARFDKNELMAYKASEKNARDYHSSLEFAGDQKVKKVKAELEDERRQKEEARSREEEARSREEEARSREEEARSREEEARSREEEARSREEEARRQKDAILKSSAKKLFALGESIPDIAITLDITTEEVERLLSEE